MRGFRYGVLLICIGFSFPASRLRASDAKTSGKTPPAAVPASNLRANAVKIYKSSDGLKLTIVRLTPASDKKALLKVTGSDTDFDGKVVMHDVEENGDKTDYAMRLNGSRYVTVAVRGGSYVLYVPGKKGDGITVSYDGTLSDAAKAADVIQEFETQNKK